MQKAPVESAAAEEIGIGRLRQLFLDDFHKRLGKHKTLSTLTTRPRLLTRNYEVREGKTCLLDLERRSRTPCPRTSLHWPVLK